MSTTLLRFFLPVLWTFLFFGLLAAFRVLEVPRFLSRPSSPDDGKSGRDVVLNSFGMTCSKACSLSPKQRSNSLEIEPCLLRSKKLPKSSLATNESTPRSRRTFWSSFSSKYNLWTSLETIDTLSNNSALSSFLLVERTSPGGLFLETIPSNRKTPTEKSFSGASSTVNHAIRQETDSNTDRSRSKFLISSRRKEQNVRIERSKTRETHSIKQQKRNRGADGKFMAIMSRIV